MKSRSGSVSIQRVDAHADLRDYIDKGFDVTDWVGNELADYLAGEAAAANKVSLQLESGWHFLNGRAVKILKRAMAVHKLFMEAVLASGGQARGVRLRQEHPVHQAFNASKH